MTTISNATASAETRAAPRVKVRNPSLDRARAFLTLVVLLHHAVIPYTYYGHTDPKEFFGFDMIVLATDSFFMAMFFFLSGLFVWPGIARKGPLNYLSDRLLRLSPCGIIPKSAFRNFGGPRSRKARGQADRSGSFGSCSPSMWLPASCTGCHPTCSIRSIASRCTAAVGPRCSSRSCLPSPPRFTFPG